MAFSISQVPRAEVRERRSLIKSWIYPQTEARVYATERKGDFIQSFAAWKIMEWKNWRDSATVTWQIGVEGQHRVELRSQWHEIASSSAPVTPCLLMLKYIALACRSVSAILPAAMPTIVQHFYANSSLLSSSIEAPLQSPCVT